MFFEKTITLAEPKSDYLANKVTQHYFRDALAAKRTNQQLCASELQFFIFAYTHVTSPFRIQLKLETLLGKALIEDNSYSIVEINNAA